MIYECQIVMLHDQEEWDGVEWYEVGGDLRFEIRQFFLINKNKPLTWDSSCVRVCLDIYS